MGEVARSTMPGRGDGWGTGVIGPRAARAGPRGGDPAIPGCSCVQSLHGPTVFGPRGPFGRRGTEVDLPPHRPGTSPRARRPRLEESAHAQLDAHLSDPRPDRRRARLQRRRRRCGRDREDPVHPLPSPVRRQPDLRPQALSELTVRDQNGTTSKKGVSQPDMKIPITLLPIVCIVPFSLASCDGYGEDAGEKVDDAVEEIEHEADEIGDDIEDAVDDAKD